MAFIAWTILVITFSLFFYFRKRQALKEKIGTRKELPGPVGLPLIGNILQIGQYPNKQFSKWSKEFGPLYQVQIGQFRTLIVSDPKLGKEIFSNDAFSGRIQIPNFEFYPETPGMGIINAEGDKWEVHRRFLLRQLRDFGFGKSSMEALITDEVSEVIEMFKAKQGKPIGEIRETLRLAVVNSLWTIVSGKRFDQNDPKLLHLANNSSKTFNEVIANGGLLLFMPWLANYFPNFTGYTPIKKVLDDNREFMEATIAEKKRNFKESDLNDFIDVYLAEMKKAEGDSSSHFHGELAEKQLASTLFDLFFAGSDTTATTLAWSVLYLSKWPEVQKKLQKEISEITGNTRKVSVDDRPNMPFTLALIDEILRMSSIAPDGVQHRALVDKEFHGYFIEKDTIIQPNLYYIHHDEKIWGDPMNFRPERFLSEDGKKYVKNENLQAFQVGRRQCVGETLARDSVFLYLTNLFQQFEMKFPTSMEPGLGAEVGFLQAPLPFTVVMMARLNNK